QDYQIDNTFRVVPSVLVYESEKCNVYKELEDMVVYGNRPFLKALSLALGIEFYSINLGSSICQYEL
nr:hypothetical protein [Saprospiraceae bacterium]